MGGTRLSRSLCGYLDDPETASEFFLDRDPVDSIADGSKDSRRRGWELESVLDRLRGS